MAASRQRELDYGAFKYKNDALHCENIAIEQIKSELKLNVPEQNATPMFVYSKQQIQDNIQKYKEGIAAANLSDSVEILYAVKANYNIHLLEIIQNSGCGAVTVSGNELKLALKAGFSPEKILLNGNGKMKWEIQLALENGCMLNIDSLFDLGNIIEISQLCKTKASVLMRINPGLDVPTMTSHPYLATALKESKFGTPLPEMAQVLEIIKRNPECIQLIGLHCHIGSTVTDVSIYGHVMKILGELANQLIDEGHPISVIDIGGGLGIDYLHAEDSSSKPLPTPKDLFEAVARERVRNLKIFAEPGRSIIASAGILVTEVIGAKSCGSGEKRYLVVDAAMNDLIRPSLYGAHHSIVPAILGENKEKVKYDVVGPICESGDFLAKDRLLQKTESGEILAILDCGAYGMAMSSTYNMRGRAAEVLIDNQKWSLVRRREDFHDLVRNMMFNEGNN